MNLEQFKLATKEQLKTYGDTIPLGKTYDTNSNLLTYKDSFGDWDEYTYDSNNNELTFKNSDGVWSEHTYDSNNNLLTFKNSKGYCTERTYDSNGNRLTYKNSKGYCTEYTYDSNNNLLTFKNSKGYCTEYTYDSNSNELTFKDSNGGGGIVLIKGINYTLYYDIDSKKYKAGCKSLTYDECIEFYKEFKDEHDDAELFLETIKQHNLTLI